MNGLIILGLSFTVFSLVLAYILFSTPGKFKSKITLSIVFVYLSTALAFSLDSFMGYPSHEGIPEGSILVSAVVNEPNNGDKGSIFLWLAVPEKTLPSFLRPFVFDNASNAPRAFSIEYNDQNQKDVATASEARSKGYKVILGKKRESKNLKNAKNDSGQTARRDEDGELPEIIVIDPREGVAGKLDR